MSEEKIIFIISLPRSGSTYLQSLLSNNESVNTCSEPWILLNYVNQIKPSLVQSDVDNQLAIDAFKNYKEKFPDFNYKKVNKDFLLSLYAPLFKEHPYIIDKTPRYWEILEEIRQLFPQSKMIILKRNPLNVAESIFKTWGVDTFDKMLRYKRDLLLGPHEIFSFEKNNAISSKTYFLTYEELIRNTPEEIEKLYNWLDLPYQKTVLETANNEKIKGKYGDPFLNSKGGYQRAKNKTDSIKLNKVQKKFLRGYADFLGKEFMNKYGDYDVPKDKKKTITFSHYLHRCSYEDGLDNNEKIKFFVKEKAFTILEKIL